LGRLDFVVGDDGSVTLLELNSLPGMTSTSLYPEAAAAAGTPFPELCDKLAKRALSRPRRETPEVVPMPT
jgi:D-alanine-D-alanine ligase